MIAPLEDLTVEPQTVTTGQTPTPRPRRRGLRRPKKLAILWRDGFRCVYCGRDLLTSMADLAVATIDHVQPLVEGGSNGDDNLVASCYSCNISKQRSVVLSIPHARSLIEERRQEIAEDYRLALQRLMSNKAKSGVQLTRADQLAWNRAHALCRGLVLSPTYPPLWKRLYWRAKKRIRQNWRRLCRAITKGATRDKLATVDARQPGTLNPSTLPGRPR